MRLINQPLQPYSIVRGWDDKIKFLRNYRFLSHSLFQHLSFVKSLEMCYNMGILVKEGVIVGFTDETVRFNLDDSNKKEISETLKDVYVSLNEKGYNPINQIVGYVLSGDPAYVPRYNNARNQIRKYERDEIVEELVRYYLKGQGIDL